MNVTYVSALYDIYNKHNVSQKLIEDVQDLFNCPIKLYLFADSFYFEKLQNLNKTSNIHIIFLPIEELHIYNLIVSNEAHLHLPENRNFEKDTIQYMALMNTKVEFLYRAVAKDLVQTEYVGWIDAGISKIFSQKEQSFRKITHAHVSNLDTVLMPGCYLSFPSLNELFSRVNWVCMGGFFICKLSFLSKFHNICLETVGFFLINKHIAWEVNVWAEIMKKYPHIFVWYKADHNDCFTNFPTNVISYV